MKPYESHSIFDDVSVATETSGRTSNPKPKENFSSFGDGYCGEALYAQQVTIDFTPKEDIDNDYVQRKVCSFWDFIESTPEIQNLKVKSEPNRFLEASITPSSISTVQYESEHSKIEDATNSKTAVDILEISEEKNMLRSMFAFKLPQSQCSLGSREYKERESVTRPKKKNKKKADVSDPKKSAHNLTPLRLMSRQLNEWDARHPRSSDSLHPNARVYMFTISCYAFHPLIQKFVRLWRYVQIVSDILTCILSMICCQCVDAMPLSTSASCETKPSIQVFDAHALKQRAEIIDQERSSGEPLTAQHLVIDFAPGREDTPEIQARCQQFWDFARNQTELEGMMVEPPQHPEQPHITTPAVHADKNINNLPAIHMMKKIDKKGVVKAALGSGEVNQYFT